MSSLDSSILIFINHLPHPNWLEKLVLFLDAIGHFKVILCLVFLLFVVGLLKKNKQIYLGAVLLGLALVSSSFLVFILKNLIYRPRPFLTHSGLHVLGQAQNGSFPSGHAALYGTLGTFMIFYFKKSKAVWLALILVGGLARIYQGVHYPSDILAGWLLAFGVVLLLKRFFISFFKTNEL